jgi:hypothetical protein
MRFRWHEHVIADRKLTRAAVIFAGLVMHRYRAEQQYAAISHRAAAKKLGMTERSMLRAIALLVERGWLYKLNDAPQPGFPNVTARYSLGNGPDDLDLGAHADMDDSG